MSFLKKVKIPNEVEKGKIPGFLLWQVSKLWQRQIEFTFKDLNLSHTQLNILGTIMKLKQEEKEVTQRMISNLTGIDPVTVSQTIRLLEKKKFIKRVIPDKDKRANYITPTEKGAKIMIKVIKRLQIIQEEFFKPLDSEVDQFTISMKKLFDGNKKFFQAQ